MVRLDVHVRTSVLMSVLMYILVCALHTCAHVHGLTDMHGGLEGSIVDVCDTYIYYVVNVVQSHASKIAELSLQGMCMCISSHDFFKALWCPHCSLVDSSTAAVDVYCACNST